MAKRYYWLKLKEDFFRNKIIKKLRKVAGGDTYVIIYLKLQLLSLKNEGVLIYDGLEETFAKELSLEIDEDEVDIDFLLFFLKQAQAMEEFNDNEFTLLHTVEMIGSEGASAERVREFRERKNQERIGTSNNVTSNVTKTPTKSKRFVKPTIEELQDYRLEKNLLVDIDKFYDFYESKGWKIGTTSMKDWKASMRNWARRNQKDTTPSESAKSKEIKKNLFGGTKYGN